MKILLVSGAFPPMPLAEANHALHLADAMARNGADVHVLTTRGAVTDGFPFQVHAIMRNWSWMEAPRFARFVRRCSPDAILMIYIAFMYGDHPMAAFAPTIAKAVRPEIPFVTQFENVLGRRADQCSLGTRIIRRVVKHWAGSAGVDYEFGTLLRDSDRVIVLSGRIETRLAKFHPPMKQKSVLIPPPPIIRVSGERDGASREAGRALLSVKPDDFTLVYFGYIYPGKGLETLLRAFHVVKGRAGNARLVIAGGIAAHLYEERLAYVKDLERLAATLGIRDEITWTGHLDWNTDDASLYLHAADACVLPFDDGVSMNNSTFAAAAAHGRPIISTSGPILEQPFLHGENVFLCPPRDPEALAGAIETLMRHPELRGRLAAGALTMTEEWFSWDKAVARTMATLR